MKHEKRPGTDGFGAEFFKCFGSSLDHLLLELYIRHLKMANYPPLKRKALLLVFPRAINLEVTLKTGDQSLSLMSYTKLDLPVSLTELKESTIIN